MDDIVSSDEEWEESDFGNPPNTTNDPFNLIWMLKKTLEKGTSEAQRSDLAGKKSTKLVKYLQYGILAHKINMDNLPSKYQGSFSF
ncbi:hypothetical protein Tco_0438007 [Tanacetum coccineum]